MVAKLTTDIVRNRLINKNLVLLSDYKNKRTKIQVQCYCGRAFTTNPDSVFTGLTQSCGCARNEGRNAKDITGIRFGKLVALKSISSTSSGRIWECVCDCGRTTVVPVNRLSTGNTKSCGHCNLMKNGKATSRPVFRLLEKLGRGCHNYDTNCGINVDIAFSANGSKIAVEYDSWYWHQNTQDKDSNKHRLLLDNGWKVLRIRTYRRVEPSILDIMAAIDELIFTNKQDIILTVPQWGNK